MSMINHPSAMQSSEDDKSNRKTCNPAFGSILICRPDSDHTFSGNLTVHKGGISIEPYTYQGDLKCAPDNAAFGLTATEALANIDEFCSRFDGQQIKQDEQKLQDYFQPTGMLMSEYTIKWEPDSVGCAPGGLHDQPYQINKVGLPPMLLIIWIGLTNSFQAACKRFLGQAINDCNKGNIAFKAGGVVTDQCASYNLGNINREHLVCASNPSYSASDRQSLNPFTRGAALGAINDFCGRNLLADPNAKDTSQYGNWPKGISEGGNNGVSITVTFPRGIGSEFCPSDTPKVQQFQTGGPDCHRRLADLIVHGCDVDNPSKKLGGSLIESVSYTSSLHEFKPDSSLNRGSTGVFSGNFCPWADECFRSGGSRVQ